MEASLPPIACVSWSSETSALLFFLTLDTAGAASHFTVELLSFFNQNSFSSEQSTNKNKSTIRIKYTNPNTFPVRKLHQYTNSCSGLAPDGN